MTMSVTAHRRPLAITYLLAALFFPGLLAASQPAQPTATEIVKAAERVIERARYCTLITLDQSGQPQARVMDPFPPEEGLVVWMATNASSRKVEQIRRQPGVTLHCFAPADPGYVTLFGTAALVDAPAEKAKRWKQEWSGFYKDAYRGSDYLLIRFAPARLEIVDEVEGMRNDPATWKPVSLELTATGRK